MRFSAAAIGRAYFSAFALRPAPARAPPLGISAPGRADRRHQAVLFPLSGAAGTRRRNVGDSVPRHKRSAATAGQDALSQHTCGRVTAAQLAHDLSELVWIDRLWARWERF